MDTLPATIDVLVVGAGPAGSAAARLLASRGLSVLLADRFAFPRDKVCGDALIPDALAALARLGLDARVRAEARRLLGVRIFSPNGTEVIVDGECACLPRKRLDALLRDAAVDAGARFIAPYSLGRWTWSERGGVATLEHLKTGSTVDIAARLTLLATGGGTEGLSACGVLVRREPSAVAVRAYFEAPARVSSALDHLVITYDREILPGYGWIFPGPDDTLNVGVGCFRQGGHGRHPSLQSIWSRFLTSSEIVRSLLAEARQVSPLKGAPLRTSLAGSRLHRHGLLVIGEAAGTTYSFSGEGIGKALSSAEVAADVASEHLGSGLPMADVGPAYEERMRSRFESRFAAYDAAQRWLTRPWIADLLAWRASRHPRTARRLADIFGEVADPRDVLSARGLLESLLP